MHPVCEQALQVRIAEVEKRVEARVVHEITTWLRDLRRYDEIAPTGEVRLPFANAIRAGEWKS